MRTLSMKELSMMYFPNSTVKSAGAQLKRWINHNKELRTALEDTGYFDGQRLLTPRQVELVFHYLGEPGE